MKRATSPFSESSDDDIWEYQSCTQQMSKNKVSLTKKLLNHENVPNIAHTHSYNVNRASSTSRKSRTKATTPAALQTVAHQNICYDTDSDECFSQTQPQPYRPSHRSNKTKLSRIKPKIKAEKKRPGSVLKLQTNVLHEKSNNSHVRGRSDNTVIDSVKSVAIGLHLSHSSNSTNDSTLTSVKTDTFMSCIKLPCAHEKPDLKMSSNSGHMPTQPGHCPFCQMPFCALAIGESPDRHVAACMPSETNPECAQGISCNSTIPSHYRKFTHNILAEYLDAGPEAAESYQLSEAIALSQSMEKPKPSLSPVAHVMRKDTVPCSTSMTRCSTSTDVNDENEYTKIKDFRHPVQHSARRSLLDEYDSDSEHTFQICNKMKIPGCDSMETEASQQSEADIFAESEADIFAESEADIFAESPDENDVDLDTKAVGGSYIRVPEVLDNKEHVNKLASVDDVYLDIDVSDVTSGTKDGDTCLDNKKNAPILACSENLYINICPLNDASSAEPTVSSVADPDVCSGRDPRVCNTTGLGVVSGIDPGLTTGGMRPGSATGSYEELCGDADVSAMIASALEEDSHTPDDPDQQRVLDYIKIKAERQSSAPPTGGEPLPKLHKPPLSTREELVCDETSRSSDCDSMVLSRGSSSKENYLKLTPLASPVTPLMVTPLKRTLAKSEKGMSNTPKGVAKKSATRGSQTPKHLSLSQRKARNQTPKSKEKKLGTPGSRRKIKPVDEPDGRRQSSMLNFFKPINVKINAPTNEVNDISDIDMHVKKDTQSKTVARTDSSHVRKTDQAISSTNNIDHSRTWGTTSATVVPKSAADNMKRPWALSKHDASNSVMQSSSRSDSIAPGDLKMKSTNNTKNIKYGGKAYSKRPCPFYKRIPDTPFTVDAFCYGTIPGCKAYFLSHFHYDHYQGLTKNFQHPIYCSKVTANLVEKKIRVSQQNLRVLVMEETHYVEGVQVTLLEANHCPGSVLFLFKLRTGQILLHTGDFRATEAMHDYAALQGLHIHQLYLDTTYCDPSRAFPPQKDVIDLAVKKATEFVYENPNGIIAVGSYTIGKERIFLAIAEALDSKICVTSEKKGILLCLDDDSISSRMTLNPAESRVHVLPMKKLNYKDLSDYISGPKCRYSRVLAFEPTGWTHSNKSLSLDHIKPKISRHDVILYGIPYSEHSSYTEMKRFVQHLRPDKILPTVNNGNPQSRKNMEKLFCDWLSEESSPAKRLRQASVNDWISVQKK